MHAASNYLSLATIEIFIQFISAARMHVCVLVVRTPIVSALRRRCSDGVGIVIFWVIVSPSFFSFLPTIK